jgi:hypothetical protein
MTNNEQTTNDEHEASGPLSIYGSEASASDLSTMYVSEAPNNLPKQIRRLQESPDPDLIVVRPRQRKPTRYFGYYLLYHTLMVTLLLTEPY